MNYSQPTPQQAADYIKKLFTIEQINAQMDEWEKQYGKGFINKVDNLRKGKK